MLEIERIREALQFIPASDRDAWVTMGMATKSELGDTGFDLWEAWSQQADNFNGKDARDVWKSIKAGGKVTIGTLFHEAKVHGWRDDGTYQKPTAEELAERRRIAAERAAKEEAEEQARHTEAATKAAAIWQAATPAPDNFPYLTRKGIKAHDARLSRGVLVIPLRDGGKIHSLQFIADDGGKKFLHGGRITGCYFSIGTTKGAAALCICEGYATGGSIHEATGYPVAVAFNAGNLEAVAVAMRSKLPDLPLIVCADDDYRTAGNPGLTKATAAALAVGGLLALPDFGTDRPDGATDFNDMAQLCGTEAVHKAVASMAAPIHTKPLPTAENLVTGDYARTLDILRGSDITPEAVNWIWSGWLAAGKMHVLGGAPGTGKTTIAMSLAATVTTGGRWPDGTKSPLGIVVIWSGEDDPRDTLVPRLTLSGADLSRVYFIADVREGNERRSFDPARDMDVLKRKLAEIGEVRLLVVDPIVSAVAGDSHKNAEVRRSLQPLVDLAASMRCALLGITHFSKGTGGRDPVERLTGSLAFGALARVVLVAAKQQEDGEDGRAVRIFLRAKSNIGPDDGGFEYDLHQGELKAYPGIFSSSVLWGNVLEGAARELLATADATGDPDEKDALDDAKRFIQDLLADGPVPAKHIEADIRGAGYAPRTINRAKKIIGASSYKEGKTWFWRLDSIQVCQPCQEFQTGNVGNLGNVESNSVIEVEI